MTPEELIDELSHNVVLAQHGQELERAIDELHSALQEQRYYLESCVRRLSFKPSSRHSEARKQTPRNDRRLVLSAQLTREVTMRQFLPKISAVAKH